MEHKLKIWPPYFRAIVEGTKTFEVRKNDRAFDVGDLLVLQEYNPNRNYFTGRIRTAIVSYMIQGICGLPSDICVMGIRDIKNPV